MKKIITSIVLTILCLFPMGVFAAGNITASPSSLTIEVGSSKTFTITASNTIGDVSISSSNAGVASVSTSEWGTGMVDEHQTKSGTITVTGKNVGSATITLTLDAATFDGEDLSGQTRTVTVNVVPKPTNNNNDNNNSNGGSNTNQPPNVTDNRSKNNNIKELAIEGYNIVKGDGNNYTLTVSNNITSVKVKAVAEDTKAKVTGAGQHDLNVGENSIEVIVTSEAGTQNKFNIKVTRKDGFYLEDLENILKNDKIDEINITINSDSKLSSQDITKIKNSGKTINFNCFDENKKIIYTWILDGSKIKDFEEVNTKINFESNNKKEISKLSNYAEGLNINLGHSGLLPNGTKIKFFVGNKYSNGDIVNIYYYNEDNNKLELVEGKYSIKDEYVIFDANKGNDYLVTMSTILDMNGEIVTQSESTSILILIIIILSLIVIASFVFIIMKKRKDKPSVNKVENVEKLDMNNTSGTNSSSNSNNGNNYPFN